MIWICPCQQAQKSTMTLMEAPVLPENWLMNLSPWCCSSSALPDTRKRASVIPSFRERDGLKPESERATGLTGALVGVFACLFQKVVSTGPLYLGSIIFWLCIINVFCTTDGLIRAYNDKSLSRAHIVGPSKAYDGSRKFLLRHWKPHWLHGQTSIHLNGFYTASASTVRSSLSSSDSFFTHTGVPRISAAGC